MRRFNDNIRIVDAAFAIWGLFLFCAGQTAYDGRISFGMDGTRAYSKIYFSKLLAFVIGYICGVVFYNENNI
jgi:hypothetical protein